MPQFQTLIGTVRTPHPQVVVDVFAKFQTLIGTVRTQQDAPEGPAPEREFQTLIGTVRT